MREEIDSLSNLKTWSLTTLPKGRKTVKTKWMYDIKTNVDESVERFKARLVAKRFTQRLGEDYSEVFSTVARYSTVRFFLALSAKYGWPTVIVDVKSAFLNADRKETIFVSQPHGFVVQGKEDHVLISHKALYGLKQSSREWHILLHTILRSIRFDQFHADKCLYVKRLKGSIILLVVYVDDMKITGDDCGPINEVIDKISAQFAVRRVDSSSKFLGMAIEQSSATIKIHHKPLINRMLLFFLMEDCYSSRVPIHPGTDISISSFSREGENTERMDGTPYRQLVGCLLHLTNTTRPDIAYTSNYLSCFMHDPSPSIWKAANSVLRYLRGTNKLGIGYSKGLIHNKEDMVSGFSDSDWSHEKPLRKSTSGYVHVCWRCCELTQKTENFSCPKVLRSRVHGFGICHPRGVMVTKFRYDCKSGHG